MNVLATTSGVNKYILICLPNSNPSATAGKKAMTTLAAKRLAVMSVGKSKTVLEIFCQ